jgi:hypothetical protein
MQTGGYYTPNRKLVSRSYSIDIGALDIHDEIDEVTRNWLNRIEKKK